MSYDLFISYAHQGDNTSREGVAALVARLHGELEADFRGLFKRDLEIFFDKEDVRDFDHWQVRCHRALRDSRFFIACLSRTYLRSDACRWEWEEWCRHELEHGLVGQGAASLWFVKLEDLDAPEDAALLRRWKGDLLQRFHVQCHEWRPGDADAFLDAAARAELQELTEHVAQRLRLLTLDRARQGNLPWPNANFVGRELELASLRAALLDAPEPSPAGIHGVGGMGKTALAQAFAYKEANDFPAGGWLLRCEGRDRLLTVFRTLVSDLEIELTDEEKLDDAKAVRRVFDVLRPRGPALFLLDNVDSPQLLAQEQMKLLADQPWARVLYTTRLAPNEFTRAGAKLRPLDLDRLPENQAADLIRRYQPGQAFASPEHEAAGREIVRELSGLTLAVETAAVYLGQCDPRVAEPQYAVDIRSHVDTLREDLRRGRGEGLMSQLREVAATLRPTLARLDIPAQTVLQLSALVPTDAVTLPWLRAIAGRRHPELAVDAAIGQSDPWTQLVRTLIGMRLFLPTPEPRVITVHRFLQRVLDAELREDRKVLREGLVALAFERSEELENHWHESESKWEISPLVAFANQLLNDSDDEGPRLVKWLCQWLGAYDSSLDQVNLIRRALSQQQNNPNTEPTELAITLNNLGSILRRHGKFTEAEPLLRKALAIDEEHREPTHQFIAIRLNNLTDLLEDMKRFAEAEPLARRALTISEQSLGLEHPSVAICLNNLANLLRATSRFAEAEALFRRALAIVEQCFGQEHPEVAASLHNLALLIIDTNRLGEAEALLRRALAIEEKCFGSEHSNVASCLNSLATLLQDTNRLAEAEPLMRRALEIEERCFGPDHHGLAAPINNLATLLQASNRLAEAEPLNRRALAIIEKSFGPEHPSVATSLNNLAQILQNTNRLSEAEPLMRRAIAIFEKSLGEQAPGFAASLSNLAMLLQMTNRLAEAELLVRRAQIIDEQSFGPDHPQVAIRLLCVAHLLQATNRLAEAETMMRRAIKIFQKSLGVEHPNLASGLNNLATLLQATNRGAEAERLMRQALAIRERSLGQNHPHVAVSLNNLAQLLQLTNRLAEAEPLMRRALAIREQALVIHHPATLQSMHALAELLETAGRYEEALPLRQRALEAQDRTLGPENPDTLRGWNNFSVALRRQGHAELAEPVVRRVAAATAKLLGNRHPLAINRYANLVLTLIMLGKLEDARQILAANWRLNALPHANTTPRIAFLGHVIALFESQPNTPFLGQLKTLLTGLELPVASDVAVPWDIAYFIELLTPKLGDHIAEFLTALVGAMNDRAKLPDLDRFPEWRDQPPSSIEIPP